MSTASRKSRKRSGGRKASGEGPTFSSSLYLDGGLERGCSTWVSLPWGKFADALDQREVDQDACNLRRDQNAAARHRLQNLGGMQVLERLERNIHAWQYQRHLSALTWWQIVGRTFHQINFMCSPMSRSHLFVRLLPRLIEIYRADVIEFCRNGIETYSLSPKSS